MRLPCRVLSAVLAVVALLPFAARAQDTRTVIEPTFPATCTTLTATQAIANSEPTSETTFDTTRIQTALTACGAGKAVELTTSGTNNAFLIAPLNIPTGVTLLVDAGVTVFGSRNPADYQVTTAGVETCGTVGTKGNGCNPLISVNGGATSTGAGLMGFGLINGRGGDKLLVNGVAATYSWWDQANTANTASGAQNNPILLYTTKASNFTLYKISLLNSPMFHVKYQNASGFTVWGIKIVAPYTARNTDGIDPTDNVSNITIANSYLSDGDDNVAIGASSAGSPASNISITNDHTYSGHGLSIGSYTVGGVSNVAMTTIAMAGNTADSNAAGLKIKSSQDRGGLVNNVQYTNVCIQNERYPLQFNPTYNTNTGTLIPQYTNIGLHGVTVTTLGNSQIQLQGLNATHLLGITLDNLYIAGAFAATPVPQYATINLGPGPVTPVSVQQYKGTGITYTGNITNPSEVRYLCPATMYPFLAGELFLSNATLTNQRTLAISNTASFTLNAVVEIVEAASTAPTSPIQFYEGTTQVGTATLGGNGTLAQLTLSNIASGAHTYTARYPADTNYAVVNFGSVTVNVNTTATTTTMTATPTTAVYGNNVSLVATVTPSSGTTAPGGTVSFQSAGNVLGTATVTSNNTATLSLTTLPVGTNPLIAYYGGSTNFATSDTSASPLNVTITSAGSSATVVASPANAVYGSTITVTATVTSATTGTPTGTVTIMDGSNALGAATLSGNTAVFTTTALTAGAHTLTAVYGGDSNFTGSTSAKGAAVTIFTATTTTTVGFTSGSVAYGTTVTMIAAINSGNAATASGTISFTDNGAPLAMITINVGDSSASYTTSTLGVGTHNIVATYSGDTNYTGSMSAATPLVVNQAGTSTTLGASSTTITYGTNDTFTATVSPSISGTPSGTVTFMDGSAAIGTGTLSGGQATYSSATLAGGSHSITAVYGGDTNFTGSTSTALIVTVNTAPTTTSLTTPASITYGGTAALSATVASAVTGTPTGTVTFKDGASTLGTGTLSGGTATYTATGLTGGSHSITAVYGGDTNFAASMSAASALTVNKANTTTSVAANPTTLTYGATSSLTATIASAAATGTVNFYDGSALLGTSNVANGTATLTTSVLSAGAHSITALYSGDTNYNTSTSGSAASITVNQASSTTSLSASPTSISFGSATTLTATVPASATGTVTFKDGSATLGTGTVSGGKATYSATALAGGSHSITAVYGGDGNYIGSASTAVTVTVGTATTTVSVAANPTTLTFGAATSLTATISSTSATGSVTFKDGTNTLGAATAANGVATFSATGLTGGSHSITAVYAGDSNFSGATSSAITVTVSTAGTTTAVSANPATITFGAATTLSATVSNTSATGTITFKDGATTLGSGTIANGGASYNATALAGGTHSITAVYSGDTNFSGSTSAATTVTVNTATLTASIGASPATAGYGSAVTFTVTLSNTAATGTITFRDGSTTVGNGNVVNGVATYASSTLSVGSHSITGAYSGDTNFAATTTTAASVTITLAPTTTGLTANPAAFTYGGSTLLTATVSPSAATGTCTFKDGTTALGVVTISNGVATLNVATLTAGTHSLTVSCTGDSNYAGSTSPVTTVTVSQLTTTTALTATPAATTFGTATLLAATVSNSNATGTVTFTDGQATVGTATLNNGKAGLSVTSLSVGSHSIIATYSGDNNYGTSASSAVAVTVSLATTTANISATPTSGVFGSATAITVTVAPSGATGLVTFKDGSNVLGTASLSGGSASFSATLSAGTHALSASYAGDSNYAASATTNNATVTISVAASAVSVSAAPASTAFGTATNLSASVSPSAATGTVTFRDSVSGLALGSGNLANGSVTLTNVYLSPAGSHTITATYSGDTNVGGATSAGITVIITPGASTTTLANSPASPVMYGTKLTLSTTNTVALGVAPTGTVQYFDGTTSLGSAAMTLNASNAPVSSFSVSTLMPGVHSLTAVYSGDANYAASTSAPISVTVNQTNSTTTLTFAPPQTVPGQAFSMNATVASTTTGTPTGSVTFTNASNVVLGAVQLINGSASLSQALSNLGTYNYTATYSGDVDYTTSTSTASVIVKQLSSTTAITASPNSGVFGGGTYSVTAVVTSTGTASGSVTFKDGATVLGTATLTSNTAMLTNIMLAGGVHSIIATYSGDPVYTSSDTTAAPAVITVTTAATTTGLSVTPTTSTFGTAITFSGGVTTSTTTPATGTITFKSGSTVLGTGTLANGGPSFTTTTLPIGTYNVTAVYSGDTNYSASTSTATVVTVNQIPQVITLAGVPSSLTYGATPFVVSATSNSGLAVTLTLTGPATLTGSTVTITGVGTVTLTAKQAGTATYAAATTVVQSFVVAAAPLTVTVTNQSILAGAAIPTLTGSFSGVVNGDNITVSYSTTATAASAPGTYPIVATIADPGGKLGNYTVTNTPGTLTITANAQTITFPAIPTSAVYGVSTIALTATASSNLAVTYAVSGPASITGSTLVINGFGSVTVTASQAGSNTYGAATPVSQTITISQAPLTIAVANKSINAGAAIPTLTGTVTGVVNGDNITVTYATTATSASSAGTYPITATISDPGNKLGNYVVTNTAGVLTISANAQTITFPALSAAVTYGVAPATLSATSTSGLAVTYTISGPATLTSSTLTITGAGTVVVTASQAGNNLYSAATPITQTITVAKAALTVTVANQSINAGAAIPTLTGAVSGIVNGDNITVAYSTTATATSAPGTYPITAILTDPSARLVNYTVTNTAGTLTITANAQTITFPALPPAITYGAAPSTVTATATSGLAVSFAVTGPATLTGSTLTYTGAGTVAVTATQAGNTNYSAATAVVQTILVAKAPLTVTVASASRVFGTANPTLTGTFSGIVNGDAITVAYSTVATATSTPGTYPIIATFTDPANRLVNYAVNNTAGTLTITAAATSTTFTLSTTAILTNGSVTLTAAVASSSGAPATGTVTFLNGSVTLGTANIVNGTGSATLSNLAAGTYSITASFGSNVNYAVSVSAAQTLVVAAPFTAALSPSSLSLAPGVSATSVLTLTPGGGFTGAVTLSCASPATYITCTVPASINLAGTTAVTGNVTIAIAATAGMQIPRMGAADRTAIGYAALLPFGALLLLPLLYRRRALLKHKGLRLVAILLLAAGASALATGCGSSGFTQKPPPAGTQTVIITATGGGTTVTSTLSVTITN